MDPNILSPIYLVLVIILAIERPASAKSKSQIKHEVRSRSTGATRFSEPVLMRNERQGANLCAIEIILQTIWNGTKA
jgi:hypothetical protein